MQRGQNGTSDQWRQEYDWYNHRYTKQLEEERRREKGKAWLIAGLIVLVVALLVGAVFAVFYFVDIDWPIDDWGFLGGFWNEEGENGREEPEETTPENPEGEETIPEALAQVTVSDASSWCAANPYGGEEYFCYHIPQVELEAGKGADISAVIAGELQGILDESVIGDEVPYISCMHYSWGRRDNAVSVLVYTRMTTYDWSEFYIYHVSAESGEILDDSDIIASCGYRGEVYRELLESKVRAFYHSKKEQIISSIGASGLEELVSRSLTEENLAAARPYIDENGDLCAVVNCYWYAGADYYPVLLNLTGTGGAEYPECSITHDPDEPLTSMLAQAQVGDIITFGSYEQDGNRNNGTEAITWRVLAKENGRLLVISEYGLENLPYHHSYTAVTWETCSLRSWLNGTFYNEAFTQQERRLIPLSTVEAEQNPVYNNAPGNDTRDYVFLLNTGEVDRYFDNPADRRCEPTIYVKGMGRVYLDTRYHSYGWWWLRTVGEFPQDACTVNTTGEIDYKDGSVDNVQAIVRPAMWIEYE